MINIIVNPHAGNGKAKWAIGKIRKFLNKQKLCFRIFYSLHEKHIYEIVSEIENTGESNIVGVGGDGTFHEIVNAVRDVSKVKLGFIPAGFGNDFALTLNLKLDPVEAFKDILKNEPMQVDMMECDGIRALSSIIVGSNIKATESFATNKKMNLKNYKKSVIDSLYTLADRKLAVVIDDENLEDKNIMFAAICSGEFIGGGIRVSPHSHYDDGKINFVQVEKLGKHKFIGEFSKLKQGKHIEEIYVTEKLCDTVNIVENGEEQQSLNIDGEIYKDKICDVKIIKKALNTFSPIN